MFNWKDETHRYQPGGDLYTPDPGPLARKEPTSMAFKKIHEYTDDELNQAIKEAEGECAARGIDWWCLFKGIDAYFEQRRRKQAAEALK